MNNLNIIYDDRIDIWLNQSYRQLFINPNEHIVSQTVSNPLAAKGFVINYDYGLLNLTGKVVDLRTNV